MVQPTSQQCAAPSEWERLCGYVSRLHSLRARLAEQEAEARLLAATISDPKASRIMLTIAEA